MMTRDREPVRARCVEGVEICGRYFEEETVLGVNSGVVNWDQEVFGVDAAVWRRGRGLMLAWTEQGLEGGSFCS